MSRLSSTARPARNMSRSTPVFLQKLADVTAPWRDKLSTDIVVRARQEMKKKGVEF